MYSESEHAKTYKQRPITAYNSGNQRPLSATHQQSRKINSSKPLSNKIKMDYTGEEGSTDNNNDLFEDPNFEEN